MNYSQFFDHINAVLKCWRCHVPISANNIDLLDVGSGKIHYRCGCGNRGFRTITSLRSEAMLRSIVFPYDDVEVSYVDFDLPFVIRGEESILNRTMYRCDSCGIEFETGDEKIRDGHIYCPGCFSINYANCGGCGVIVARARATLTHTSQTVMMMVCPSCRDNHDRFVTCESCGDIFAISLMHGSRCGGCYAREDPRYGSELPAVSFHITTEGRESITDKESEV